jgi:hypothetical protein
MPLRKHAITKLFLKLLKITSEIEEMVELLENLQPITAKRIAISQTLLDVLNVHHEKFLLLLQRVEGLACRLTNHLER